MRWVAGVNRRSCRSRSRKIVAISVEAGELLELFQWMKDSDSEKVKENDDLMGKIEGELADILNLSVSMANALDLDLALPGRVELRLQHLVEVLRPQHAPLHRRQYLDVGDRVRVQLISIDVERGFIDFKTVGQTRH